MMTDNTNARCIGPDGERVDDSFILSWITRKTLQQGSENIDLIVGTDSHKRGRLFRFVTVVCVYVHGKGGMYYYTLSYEPKTHYPKNAQQFRMFQEVQKSVEMADFLFEHLGIAPIVDIDASPKDAGQFTSSFSDGLRGLAVSSGYECRIKSDSVVASSVADHHTRS